MARARVFGHLNLLCCHSRWLQSVLALELATKPGAVSIVVELSADRAFRLTTDPIQTDGGPCIPNGAHVDVSATIAGHR